MNQESKNSSAIVGIIAVVIIGLVVAGTILLNRNSSDSDLINDQAGQSAATSENTNNSQSSESETGNYKDGTYSSRNGYSTPGGNEEITITITIQDNKVTQSSVTGLGVSRESRQYQQEFINNYQELVDGRTVDGIKLSRVAGSSLTSNGFNKALDAIRNQAKF